MRPLRHAAASLALSAGTAAVSGSLSVGAAALLSGIFIDLDHLPECALKYGLKRSIREWFMIPMHLTDQKTYILFHGFDVSALVFAGLWWTAGPAFAWAVFLGLTLHLLMDQLGNPLRTPWAYFLSYRISKKFETEAIYYRLTSKEYFEKKRRGEL